MSDEWSRRYTDGRVPEPGIKHLFSAENRFQRRLDVEAALAQAEAEVGLIPEDAGAAIQAAARIEKLDLSRIADATVAASHPLVPLVDELARVVGPEHGEWIHWGATTQNITQTADILVLRDVQRALKRHLAATLRALSKLADSSAAVPMPGRTHSQHAVPVTFGFKTAVWIDELTATVDRLERLEDRLFRVLMGGAVGTFASFGPHGRAVERGVAERLGLGTMPVPSRAVNDGMVEFVVVLGLLAGTAGKIGKDVYALMQPEFGEAFEPIPHGTVGSSTMPHKRNPQLALDVQSMSAQLRALAGPALESMMHDHEANGGMTALLEDLIGQAATLSGDLLVRLSVIMSGLELDEQRMRANLALSEGLMGSESLMLELGERIGRQSAHELVYEIAQTAAVGDESFLDLLLRNGTVREHLDAARIRRLVDPSSYLGESVAIAHDMARHARTVADRLDFHAQAGALTQSNAVPADARKDGMRLTAV
ncbi:class-II fumarase/aspartase family protein [Myceligenerans indicum]|uniref:Adenylosuccinate lyase family protein n=1 Tax=Myceligenerans indicum TaxID=2593663 RepID=A0ABS1LIV6_9MICO|nr:adenylosuccinate lyase family protein [Myceligenerans indicum]MBL0886084.1 adenylosuccinate lyase family protein [Myceligenerans indicum]